MALADIIALEGTIISYIAAARKVDRVAASAFVPYAAWVAFAGVLNAEIARRIKGCVKFGSSVGWRSGSLVVVFKYPCASQGNARQGREPPHH